MLFRSLACQSSPFGRNKLHLYPHIFSQTCGNINLKPHQLAILTRLKIIGNLCSIAFLIIMVYQGIRMISLASWQTSPAMEIPMSYVYIAIPLGCAAMLLVALDELVEILRGGNRS